MLPAPVLTGRHERLKRPHRDSVGPLYSIDSKVFAVLRDQDGRAKQHVQAIRQREALRSLRRKSTKAISRSLPPTEGATSGKPGDDVVDDDFEAVDDEKKKS
jgi:hypothetical protein